MEYLFRTTTALIEVKKALAQLDLVPWRVANVYWNEEFNFKIKIGVSQSESKIELEPYYDHNKFFMITLLRVDSSDLRADVERALLDLKYPVEVIIRRRKLRALIE